VHVRYTNYHTNHSHTAHCILLPINNKHARSQTPFCVLLCCVPTAAVHCALCVIYLYTRTTVCTTLRTAHCTLHTLSLCTHCTLHTAAILIYYIYTLLYIYIYVYVYVYIYYTILRACRLSFEHCTLCTVYRRARELCADRYSHSADIVHYTLYTIHTLRSLLAYSLHTLHTTTILRILRLRYDYDYDDR